MYEYIRFVTKINDQQQQQQLDKDKLKCLIILLRCWFSAVSFERLSYIFSQCSLFRSMPTPLPRNSSHPPTTTLQQCILGSQWPGACVASSGFMSQNEMEWTCIVCVVGENGCILSRQTVLWISTNFLLTLHVIYSLRLYKPRFIVAIGPVICCSREIEHD